MIFQCPICNSIYESKNSFQIKRFQNEEIIEHRLECEVYKKFLSIISDKVKINENVIDILYLTEGLNNVIDIDINYISNNYISLVIPEIINYRENYQKSIYYIFANFITVNPDYTLLFEYFLFYNNLYLVNKDVKIRFKRKDFENKILCSIKFDIEECIPYCITLLTDEEREKLGKNILSTPNLYQNSFDLYKDKALIISENDNINVVYEKIEQQIKDLCSEVNNITMQLFEDNKKYFERALLELELKKF